MADSDDRLVRLEREVAAAYQAAAQGRRDGLGEDDLERLYRDAAVLDEEIRTATATTPAGAAVQLRRLLDPNLGIASGVNGADEAALKSVLGVIVALMSKGG